MFAITDNLQETIGEWLDKHTFYQSLILAVLFGAAAWLLARAVGLAFRRLQDQPRYRAADRTALRFLGQLAQLGVYLFAFLTYAQQVPALRALGTAWLASVGVVSVVLGLAAQNTLGNLIAGISLLLYRPFNLGDRLQVIAPTGLETGVVESLNLGYTILRTFDNRRVVIPNSAMASQTNVNLTLTDVRARCVVPVRISHKSNVDHVRNVLAEIAKAHPSCLEYIGCPLIGLGNSSVILNLLFWTGGPQIAADTKNELLETIMKRFAQEKIEMFCLRQNVFDAPGGGLEKI